MTLAASILAVPLRTMLFSLWFLSIFSLMKAKTLKQMSVVMR